MIEINPIRTLLVEDNARVAEELFRLLRTYSNIDVVGLAVDGEEALLLAAKLQPTVVVMDINLPKVDGITATFELKRTYPHITVIGLTVLTEEYVVYAMLKAGAFEVLAKRQAVNDLYSTIQRSVASTNPNLILDKVSRGEKRQDLPVMSKYSKSKRPATLGDILYAQSKSPLPEQEWATLVRSIAAGDQLALHALYERAHRLVFTLIMRITANRKIAEEVTVDVFHDIWRRASRYDAVNGTVLGWIMNQARSRAIDRLRLESRKKPGHGGVMEPLAEVAADPGDALALREQGQSLRAAVAALTPDERQAIETTLFAGLPHAEAAARLNQPLAIIKASLHSGLHKLRLSAEADNYEMSDMSTSDRDRCEQSEVTLAYMTQVLSATEAAAAEAHIASCPACQRELESFRPVVNWFVSWPTDVLRPTICLQKHLARRIAEETGRPVRLPSVRQWVEPEWEQVAPGIECKLLATDTERQRVSMLVRLASGASYPAHTHAGVEELHLLDGELWIDERKLLSGDYYRAVAGTGDDRIWSETGCTCVLVTSFKDALQ